MNEAENFAPQAYADFTVNKRDYPPSYIGRSSIEMTSVNGSMVDLMDNDESSAIGFSAEKMKKTHRDDMIQGKSNIKMKAKRKPADGYFDNLEDVSIENSDSQKAPTTNTNI